MSRLDSLKRLYKGMAEHARQLNADGLKQRYAPKPATPAPVAAAPAAPQVSDDDMAALSDGLE